MSNPKHRCFGVRLELESPIIPGRRLHLDGILAALILDATGDADRAHNDIPLDHRSGVWCGSQILLEGPVTVAPVTYTQSLRPNTLSPELIAADGHGGRIPPIDIKRGTYQNKVTAYAGFEATAAWFCGRGDLDAVERLLRTAVSIGTKRSSGFGWIRRSSLEIEEVDDTPTVGLAFTDGTPARAVPSRAWLALGGQPAVMSSETTRPPYWWGTKEICVVPDHLEVSRDQAAKLIGINLGS